MHKPRGNIAQGRLDLRFVLIEVLARRSLCPTLDLELAVVHPETDGSLHASKDQYGLEGYVFVEATHVTLKS